MNITGKSYAKLEYELKTETVIAPQEEHNNKKESKNSENMYII